MRAYEYKQFGLSNLSPVERDEPQPRAREVIVKFHAASLNCRDVLFDPLPVLLKAVRLQGVVVGSRRMFEEMNRAVASNRLRPVVGKTFAFDEAREALKYMESGSHFGKIVITFQK